MPVHNIHQRRIAAPPARVGELLDTLASGKDRLWPHERWPPMKLDTPLGIGATGGHGPIRYVVEAYDPGVQVVCLTNRVASPPLYRLNTNEFMV